jgi:hypothetical protein
MISQSEGVCYGIVYLAGTGFIGGRAVFKPAPRPSARLAAERFAGQRELVRVATVHSRVRKDLEWLQDSLPLR